MENVLFGRESAAAGVDKKKPMGNMHGEPLYGKLVPIGAKVFIKPLETKGDSTSNMEPTSLTGVSPDTSYLQDAVGAVSTWSGLSKSSLTLVCHRKAAYLRVNSGTLTTLRLLKCLKKVLSSP